MGDIRSILCGMMRKLAARQPRPVSGEWLQAIEDVESGGQRDPDRAVGDNGLAVGRYQIHPDYWEDATGQRPDAAADGRMDPARARDAVISYMNRYGAQLDDEGRALLHHYGPNWRDATRRTVDRINRRDGTTDAVDPYIARYRNALDARRPQAQPQARQQAGGDYTVRAGDTLWGMWKARDDRNESWTDFQRRMSELNPGVDWGRLQAGQSIRR